MGLAGPKKRTKISHDPNNTHWSRSTDRFGHRVLSSLGWTPGTVLGSDPNSPHHTIASSTHIKVAVKDDNRGIGCTLVNAGADECTGLGDLQSLLGRLNGKSDAEVVKEEEARRKVMMTGRFGMRFVEGGVYVSSDLSQLVEELKMKEEEEGKGKVKIGVKEEEEEYVEVKIEEEDVKIKLEDGEEGDKGRKKLKRKRDVEDVDGKKEEDENEKQRRRKEKKDKKKKDKKDKSKSKDQSSKSKESSKSKPSSSSSSSSDTDEESTDRKQRKEEKRLKKQQKKEEKDRLKAHKKSLKKKDKKSREDTETTSTTTSGSSTPYVTAPATPLPNSGTSTPIHATGRHVLRSKWIAQKRAAVMDAKALNEILMIKA